MQKELLLKIASHPKIRQFVSESKLTRKMVNRFVAGEDLDHAILVARNLNKDGKRVSLDYLGESVTRGIETQKPLMQYLEMLSVIQKQNLDANVSLKLTQLGLGIDNNLCEENLKKILEKAAEYNNFVRIDMESSRYTEDTLGIFYKVFDQYKNVGPVIQAYLYRSQSDVRKLIEKKAKVRLCKGAYMEKPNVAFPKKAQVDANYTVLTGRLLRWGNFPGIATQDEFIINHAKKFTNLMGIAKDQFEFQMLYNIRKDLQDQLVEQGYGIRVYAAFGEDWYPFFTRRLAERPANLLFLLKNVLKY